MILIKKLKILLKKKQLHY